MTSDRDSWLSYHEGELAVQRRAGVRHGPGAVYRAAMPAGVREFLAQQQLVILASIGNNGRLWASLRPGAPGFVTVIDEQTLRIGGYGHPEDLLARNLMGHDQLGLLVIDLATRSRLRLNGTAALESDGAILLKTKQVYGNCQKYIQTRTIVGAREAGSGSARRSERLDALQQSWIAGADTFFIATAHPRVGADASHRGGLPGFVRVESASRLVFPDYRGNRMFNTLGNLESNSRAGLLFPDFAAGAALRLSGDAAVLWDDPRLAKFPAPSGWSPSTSRKLSNSPKPRIFASGSPATRPNYPDKNAPAPKSPCRRVPIFRRSQSALVAPAQGTVIRNSADFRSIQLRRSTIADWHIPCRIAVQRK